MSTIRVTDEDKNKIINLCKQTKMNQGVLIGYMADKFKEYNMLDPEWLDVLVNKRFAEMLEEVDLSFRKTIEVITFKAVLKAKHLALKQWLEILPAKDKREFLENIMGNPTNTNFLDQISSYQMYVVNGGKRIVSPDKTGAPMIPGATPEQVITCETGWHVKGAFCNCRLWRTCPIRIEEVQNWLAVHGTTKEQEEYLVKPFQPKLIP